VRKGRRSNKGLLARGRDRAGARAPSGGEFRRGPRFPGPPYDPGRSDFPSPVLTLAVPREPSHRRRGSNAGSYTPLPAVVCSQARRFFEETAIPGSESEDCPAAAKCPEPLCPARVLPLPGWCRAPPRRALPLLHSSYGLMRRTITLPPPSASASFGGSLQVATSPCWEMALPDVISASPSLDAWTCTPVVRKVLVPVSSPATSAFPTPTRRVGTTIPRQVTSAGLAFRGR